MQVCKVKGSFQYLNNIQKQTQTIILRLQNVNIKQQTQTVRDADGKIDSVQRVNMQSKANRYLQLRGNHVDQLT
jgi:hypothetical protein